MEKRNEGWEQWPTGLIEVAPSTYAYVQAGGAAGISNAGLIVGPDRACIVDALVTIPLTALFLSQIRRVTSLPISHVLLTHHHLDHFLGLQNLMPAPIVCHTRCRETLLEVGSGGAARWSERHPQFAEGLQGFRACLPDQTFEDRLTFYLGEREVQFFHLGCGHTHGDGLVYLPQSKVLFAGDVAFHKVTPQGFHGHIGNWIKIVNHLLAMDIETIVPGHGPVGGKTELAEMCDYLELVYQGARKCFDQGLSEAEAIAAIDSGDYGNWAEPGRIKNNVERSYQEFRGEVTVK